MYPVLVEIGGKPIIFSYGLMLMLAFVAGIFWATREAKRRRVSSDQVLDLSLFILIGSILCARITFVLLDRPAWPDYLSHPLNILLVRMGGLSFHGGLAGAVIAGILFSWRRRIPFWKLADICAPSAPLGYGIAKIGCLLRGCCYGAPTDLPWAMRFLEEPSANIWTPPSHPTQIYACLASFVVFGLLLWLRERMSKEGMLFLSYLAIYSVQRFLIEILRKGYTAEILFGPLTEAQVASIAIILCSLLGLRWLAARGAPRTHQEKRGESPPSCQKKPPGSES